MVAFTPATAPSVSGVTEKVTPRVLIADFGDSYTQRAADGINNIDRELELSWPPMSLASASAITDFFAARGGWEAFTWTSPLETTERKWICHSWGTSAAGSTSLFVVTASLKEVFDL